jgi:hypothetical protein
LCPVDHRCFARCSSPLIAKPSPGNVFPLLPPRVRRRAAPRAPSAYRFSKPECRAPKLTP